MSASLSIVFAGTPQFSVPALAALAASEHRVVAVYTQPDRPAGRGQQLATSAVKQYAVQHGLPVEQPATLRDAAAVERLAQWQADVMVVVAYGLILPPSVLKVPAMGCINIHASLLPRWRGAAPIHRAILAGDRQTGITIMQMDAGLDTGPMLLERITQISPQDTAAVLHDRLASLGAEAIVAALAGLASGSITAHPQPPEGATYAAKLRKEEALIDWSKSSFELDRQVRAFNPWPVAETRLHGQQLRIWEATAADTATTAVPGTVVAANAGGIAVATGSGLLHLTRVQLAGRKAVPAAEFLHAQRLDGTVLG
ncbi:MAG TPA: methionyl-tRNA formyltransferase [Steroidobacteraceae bacterium]|jgi:methionyl-tRNA formyltransferase